MRLGRFAQGSVLQMVRSKGLGIVRLLLVALSLQLLTPLVDAVPLGQAAALEADIASSLCHDGGNSAAPVEQGDRHGVKHCIFCLPLVGGHAVHLGEIVLAGPDAAVITVARPFQDRHALGHRRDFAFARAPPATSETI